MLRDAGRVVNLRLVSLDLVALREVPDMVCRPKREGLDRHGRLATAGGYEARAVAEEQVRDIVGAMILVDHRLAGVVTHATGAEQMNAAPALTDRAAPDLHGAGGVHNLDRAVL